MAIHSLDAGHNMPRVLLFSAGVSIMTSCLLEQNKSIRRRKNSLLELLRFLSALWVLYYHDYVPFKNMLFSEGYLAVEFFFILSGFYLMRSMNKYLDMPTKQGLFEFIKHRFKNIAIPFTIGEIFVLIYSFAFEISYNLFFGYLWYIRDLFIAMIGIFLLKKYIKSEKLFYIVLATVSIVAMFGFIWLPVIAWPNGPFRSINSIPIGMIVALIPSIKIGNETHYNKMSAIIPIVSFLVVGLGCLAIIILPYKHPVLPYLLVILVYPSLIYFANQIEYSNKFLDWLGSLSFPIYAFQCIVRVIEACGLKNNTVLFVILLSLVILYSIIIEYCKFNKQTIKI